MKRSRPYTERDIEVTGALTGAIVSQLDTQLLFRPSRTSSGTFEHLTWEVVPPQPGSGYAFVVRDLALATAEGVVSLAAAVAALRRSGVRTTIDITSDDDGWSAAVGLARLQDEEAEGSIKIADGILPLHTASNDNPGKRAMYVREIAEKVKAFLKAAGDPRAVDKAEALAAVAAEALLNVDQHAYLRRDAKTFPAFVAMTVTRPPLKTEAGSDVFTNEEHEWFDGIRGETYLEISIADCGTNIPYTLAEQFRAKFPANFKELNKNSTRSELHREIALWSFHPQSTRKSPADFATEIARLNWRGLHTALRRTADHNGAIIMQTGRTRLGYICADARPFEFSHDLERTREFPGTILTLRLPIGTTAAKPAKRGKKTEDRLPLATLVTPDEITRSLLEPDTFHSPAPIGIILPFEHLREAIDATPLRVNLEPVPPHIVPVFLPAKGTEAAWVGLAAFGDADGAPRLAGFAMPGEPIEWKLVGVYPAAVRKLVKSLETEGFAVVSEEEKPFAEMLRSAYSEQFTISDAILRNTWHGWQLDDETAFRAMQVAFDSWFAANHAGAGAAGWLFGSQTQCILLRSGRYVQRYLSVMRLLDSNELLARSVAWKLVTLIDRLSGGRNPVIVADSEASYFRLATLLRDVDRPFDVAIRHVPEPARDRPIVLFADAVYRGDTVRGLIEDARRADHVIVCLDLSPDKPKFEIPFTALLRSDFSAQEIESPPAGSEVLECDVVTNVPEPKAATERFTIGTSTARQEFLQSHPELVRHGLQRAGGRTHTVTLPCRAILQHRKRALGWLLETVTELARPFLDAKRQPSLVVFYRTDADVSRELPSIAAALEPQFEGVFGVPLPFIADGSREAFARATPRLLAGIRRLGSQSMFSARPSERYLALYIDDACVTGRTLFNFVVRAARTAADERPMGLIVIPVVTRLSPTEEYFFSDVCRQLGSGGDRSTPDGLIPFAFAPLFRLQIGSLVPADAVPINHFLTEFSLRRNILDDRSRRYADAIVERAESVFYAERATINDTPIVAHPFHVGDEEESSISYRAIHIRQLLSLHEQNLGVLGELLHEFFDAFKEKDHSVLSVLALEPRLLGVRPVHTACWIGLTRLALSALASADSEALKSDALAVLALQRDVFVKSLDEILRSIGHSRVLVDQAVTFLYQLATSTSIPRAQSLLAHCSEWPQEERRYLSRALASIERLATHTSVADENDAWNRIVELVSRFLFHATAQVRMTKFNDWVQQAEAARRATKKVDIAKLAAGALDVVDSILRPGLDVLEWMAKKKMDVDVVQRIREERPKLVHAASELQDLVSSGGRMVGTRDVQIAAVWEKIRRYSQARAAETILSDLDSKVALPSFPSAAPLIEEVLPRYVSWPTRLLHRLTRQHPAIRMDFQPSDSPLRNVVIAASPSAVVNDAFELIIADMRSHGVPGTQKAIVIYHADRQKLEITFQDKTRQKDTKGNKKSQAMVNSRAQEGGFLVRFDPPAAAGALYSVVVEFPQVFAIEIDQLR